jgi:hypothetical protein
VNSLPSEGRSDLFADKSAQFVESSPYISISYIYLIRDLSAFFESIQALFFGALLLACPFLNTAKSCKGWLARDQFTNARGSGILARE